jgi:hypothetical protein
MTPRPGNDSECDDLRSRVWPFVDGWNAQASGYSAGLTSLTIYGGPDKSGDGFITFTDARR